MQGLGQLKGGPEKLGVMRAGVHAGWGGQQGPARNGQWRTQE